MNEEQNIIIYNTPDGKASVALYARDGSVWMNQNQLAQLFTTSVLKVSMHISNILKEKELSTVSVVKDYLNTGPDGKTTFRAKMQCRNAMQKCLVIILLICTFALTVLTTLPVRTASQGESFAFIYFSKIIHLPGFNSMEGFFMPDN